MDEDDDSKIFPQRLLEILDDEFNADAISWLPHGRAFRVLSRAVFAEKVMPRYFSRKAKYSSFTRKLNRWNFVRVSSGPEFGAYYHEFFLRDKPQLTAQMYCKNARSKMAMIESKVEEPSKDAPQSVLSSSDQLSDSEPQVFALPVDIPFALLEALAKPDQSTSMLFSPAAAPVAQPGLLLQQSQYANLLLERQIQIIQREQASRMLQLLIHNDKPAAEMDERLRLIQNIRQNNQRKNGTPTNHRASAA